MIQMDEIPDAVVEKILSMKSNNICTVKVKQEPRSFYYVEVKEAVTKLKLKNDILHPNIEFKNPKNSDVTLQAFTIQRIPSTFNFNIEIYANESLFYKTHGCYFTANKLNTIRIKDGLRIKKGNSIKVFVTSVDGEKVELKMQVEFGD